MRFGGLRAVDAVSFSVMPQTITAIIGPNGAGKTTMFNCLTGFYRPTEGHILLHRPDLGPGRHFNLERLPAHRIARQAGVCRTFQNIRLFGGMTALENLLVAQHHRLQRQSGFGLYALLNLPRWRLAEREAVEKARHWLDFFGLLPVADAVAATLPYGLQRRLEIARALCTDPRLLCLDEPAAGLNPRESDELAICLRRLKNEHRLTLLLIEHDMRVVMGISDHIIVLDYGRKIAEGTPAAVRQNPAVIRAYLGEEEEGAA